MSEQEKDVTPEMLEDDAKAIMEEADRAHAEATVAANLARRRATELREARKANGGKDVELREWVSVATQIGKLIDGQAHPSGLVKRVSDFVTLLFVAFDVEIIFVYLWAITVRAVELPGIIAIGVFLAILMFGELYAWRKGDLRWH